MHEKWTRENIVWLAGYLEGEGSFAINPDRRYIGISVTSTDLDILRKIKDIFEFGNICCSYKPENYKYVKSCNPGKKTQWKWRSHKGAIVYALMVAIFPFMGIRRKEKIKECIKSWIKCKREPIFKNCEECNDTFEQKRYKQHFCSTRCNWRYWGKRRYRRTK